MELLGMHSRLVMTLTQQCVEPSGPVWLESQVENRKSFIIIKLLIHYMTGGEMRETRLFILFISQIKILHSI